MTPSGKWIDGVGPDSSVCEAARLSLGQRLAAVAHWLPLAAEQAERDVEYVHRLRVSTRRAGAALKLYADWLPPRHARWMKKRLKKIRRAAGAARDLDVLAERLHRELGEQAAGVLAAIAAERTAAQPAILDIYHRLRRKDRLTRRTRKLLDGICPRGKSGKQCPSQRFHEWAAGQLAAALEPFWAAMPTDGDVAALHEFRIQAKALRYTIELVAPAFGPELREQHYPVVEELQERLGRINDHVVGAERLRHWSTRTADEAQHQLLANLAEQEAARIGDEVRVFREWWTQERAEALRRGLF